MNSIEITSDDMDWQAGTGNRQNRSISSKNQLENLRIRIKQLRNDKKELKKKIKIEKASKFAKKNKNTTSSFDLELKRDQNNEEKQLPENQLQNIHRNLIEPQDVPNTMSASFKKQDIRETIYTLERLREDIKGVGDKIDGLTRTIKNSPINDRESHDNDHDNGNGNGNDNDNDNGNGNDNDNDNDNDSGNGNDNDSDNMNTIPSTSINNNKYYSNKKNINILNKLKSKNKINILIVSCVNEDTKMIENFLSKLDYRITFIKEEQLHENDKKNQEPTIVLFVISTGSTRVHLEDYKSRLNFYSNGHILITFLKYGSKIDSIPIVDSGFDSILLNYTSKGTERIISHDTQNNQNSLSKITKIVQNYNSKQSSSQPTNQPTY